MSFVQPKSDCPHVGDIEIEIPKNIRKQKCEKCEAVENWLCLKCRHRNSHMVKHYVETKHPICISFSDLSFWCYKCDDYIQSEKFNEVYKKLHLDKFGEEPEYEIEKKQKSSEEKYPKIDTKEYFDDLKTIKEKVQKVAALMKNSKHTVVFSGAGISTSANIPDYRGPQGIWTLLDKGIISKKTVDLDKIKPTFAHFAISELVGKDLIHFIITTNVDGLHMKTGCSVKKIANLHGNVFKEKCVDCGLVFWRDFDVTTTVEKGFDEALSKNHFTERNCEKCKGKLVDTIIHFRESLPKETLSIAIQHSYDSKLSIIVGTSLRVQPACSLPCGKVVLINLQKTPYDDEIDIKIYCKIDKFMELLMKELKM